MAAGVPLCCMTEVLPSGSYKFEGGTLVVELTKASGLSREGSARAVVDLTRKFNIIVIHGHGGRFAALDRSCTHGGGQCAYNHKRRTVQCTSLNHAEYDLDGTLLHGRTHGNLRAYEVRCIGGRIEVRLEGAA